MIVDPNEHLQADLLIKGELEPLTTELFERLLRPGHTYVDVGAHVGFHTLVARRHIGVNGRVVAIEPQPANCAHILENWRCNGFENIIVIVALAGRDASLCRLHEQRPRDRARLSVAGDSPNDEPQIFEVPVWTLGEVIRRYGLQSIQLLKIDVEGAELEVLEGLGPEISCVQNCLVEVLPDAPHTQRITQREELIAGRFEAAGFELRCVNGERWHPGCVLPENNLWATRDINAQGRDFATGGLRTASW